MMNTRDWNPRYLAYCAAHGETDPETMIERDRERFPGGCMAEFTIWIRERWAQWKIQTGYKEPILTEQAHADFDAWLKIDAAA